MSRGLKVFVSSSMEELKEERAELYKELDGLKLEPFVFEFLGADPKSPRENYESALKSADAYIGVFWKKYGDYTVDEFELAVKYNKPCFIYVKTKDGQDREKKLSNFLEENFYDVDKGKAFFKFEETDQFIDQVRKDLFRWLTENFKERKESPVSSMPIDDGSLEDKNQIHFVNRTEELKLILSEFGPKYPLLIGPLGYGKTRLLKELEVRFKEDGWLACYLEAERFISKDTEFKGFINDQSNKVLSSMELNNVIDKQTDDVLSSDQNRYDKGLVLLLDLDSPKAQEYFIPFMETIKNRIDNLRQSNRGKFFDQERQFKVVFASRYSLSSWDPYQAPLRFEPISLSTFTYFVIQESIRRHLDVAIDAIEVLTANVMYLSGGHPYCVSQIIKEYKKVNEPVDTFISDNFAKIILEIVLPVVNSIEAENVRSLNPDVNLFVRSNVFRYVYPPILQKLLDQSEGYKVKDGFSFGDKLTSSNLFTRNKDNSLIEDGLLRRLFAIKLWYSEPDKFIEYCETAQDLCLEYFRSKRCYMPEYWFIEYLFQFLQKSASYIGEQKQRDLIREKFYIELDRLLDILNQTVDDVRVEGNNILDLIKNDWEFAFTVNYYLRGEQFSQGPIKKMQTEIRRYINETRKN